MNNIEKPVVMPVAQNLPKNLPAEATEKVKARILPRARQASSVAAGRRG